MLLENGAEEELLPLSPTLPWGGSKKRTFSELDSDSEVDDDAFFELLERAFEMDSEQKKDRKRGRQGRSRESRQRAARVRDEWRTLDENRAKEGRAPLVSYAQPECFECGGELIENRREGDLTCRECGLVQETKGLGFSEHIPIRVKNKSKPYQRVVHFRQRYAQLVGKDPPIPDELFDEIWAKIKELEIPLKTFGKKDFSRVLKELGRQEAKRLSANWIQVRRRMNALLLDDIRFEKEKEGVECGELPDQLELPLLPADPCLLFKRLCARYQCIDRVFQDELWSEEGEGARPDYSLSPEARKKALLKRRNIVNVNYLAVQMLRLESEQLFREWGKFFPQLTSKKQPQTNNERWRLLILKLETRYSLFGIPRTEETLKLTWEFRELTREEIEEYCNFFH